MMKGHTNTIFLPLLACFLFTVTVTALNAPTCFGAEDPNAIVDNGFYYVIPYPGTDKYASVAYARKTFHMIDCNEPMRLNEVQTCRLARGTATVGNWTRTINQAEERRLKTDYTVGQIRVSQVKAEGEIGKGYWGIHPHLNLNLRVSYVGCNGKAMNINFTGGGKFGRRTQVIMPTVEHRWQNIMIQVRPTPGASTLSIEGGPFISTDVFKTRVRRVRGAPKKSRGSLYRMRLNLKSKKAGDGPKFTGCALAIQFFGFKVNKESQVDSHRNIVNRYNKEVMDFEGRLRTLRKNWNRYLSLKDIASKFRDYSMGSTEKSRNMVAMIKLSSLDMDYVIKELVAIEDNLKAIEASMRGRELNEIEEDIRFMRITLQKRRKNASARFNQKESAILKESWGSWKMENIARLSSLYGSLKKEQSKLGAQLAEECAGLKSSKRQLGEVQKLWLLIPPKTKVWGREHAKAIMAEQVPQLDVHVSAICAWLEWPE